MAICPPNEAINRIIAALGLKYVRSLKINAAVGDAVTVVTEQYATEDQLDGVAAAIETREWVLVPKDEWQARERERAFENKARDGVIDLNLLYPNAAGRFYPPATQPPPLAPPEPPEVK
jgi:hypothetical protein